MADKELETLVYSDNPWERRTAAMNGYRLLEEFGTDYAQLLPNGKVVTTDCGW